MDMMTGLFLVEGAMGLGAATAAFFYQRKMDREVASGRIHRWSQFFSTASPAGGRVAGSGPTPQRPAQPSPTAIGEAYRCLGVGSRVSPEELRRAYHRQCMNWHPDRFALASEPERQAAARAMKQINAAYALLAPRR